MAKVTYRAPGGDASFVTMAGVDFQDGVPVEVSNPAAVNLFKRNRYFDVADLEIEAVEMIDPPKRGPGRPPKVQL